MIINTNNNPNLIEDYKVYIQFILIKLLELVMINIKRIDLFLDKIHTIISVIMKKSQIKIIKFCFEIITSIHSFALNYYKPNKDSNNWNKSNWQINIFSIYKELSIDLNNLDINKLITDCLQKILFVSSLFI